MRKLITKLFFCTQVMLCSIALMNQAYAVEKTNSVLREASQYEDSIENLVFDQTITPEGREFYRAFIKAWSNQNKGERHHIMVYERANALGANKLWVEYRLRKLYSGVVLTGGQNANDKIGAYAAQAVFQGIAAIKLQEM